jgi:hypothetical protein
VRNAIAWRRAAPADRSLALVLALGAVGAAALAPWVPALAALAPACPFHAWTGLPCPGCGTVRATIALADFDLPGALAWNPLATLGLVAGFVVSTLALPWVEARGPVPILKGGGLPGWVRALAVVLLAAQWGWLVARGV